MGRSFVIISGGEYSPIGRIGPDDFVIACDRGYEYAAREGIKPDLVVGDFDSYSGDVEGGIAIDRYFSEKDDTDTMIAVRYAVEQGGTELHMRCALGGRLDHLLANIQAAAFAAKHGLSVEILDRDTRMLTMNPGSLSLPRMEGFSLSLFALSDRCRGVDISGAKYPLKGAELSNAFPLGVSNEWKDSRADIRLEEGLLLVVMSRLS